MTEDLWIIIMAGGVGTRFWPASRRERPKQLLPVLGRRTLLRRSVDRVLPLVGPERVAIITGQSLGRAVREILPDLPAENVILEPVGRNTAAACGLGACWLRQRAGGGIMAVLPSDHLIDDEDAFRRDLEAAAAAARDGRRLITFGLRPDRPETGYGYLEQGPAAGEWLGRTLYQVSSFREKPDQAAAEAYLAGGNYYWNSGQFVWRADLILDWLERLMPELAKGLNDLTPALLTSSQDEALARVYPGLPAQSIDYGVMEKADDVLMVASDFGWSDVGSWEAVWRLSARDQAGNALSGPVLALDSKDNLVQARDKLVALLGVRDLVIIETEDALLIMERGRAQEVGRILDRLRDQDREDLL